jgi:hypothetical protein
MFPKTSRESSCRHVVTLAPTQEKTLVTGWLLLPRNARDPLWDRPACALKQQGRLAHAPNVHASTHGNSCFAGHCGMNSVLCQMPAIDAVVGISGYSFNHVARIDIFEPHVKRPFLKIFLDMALEKHSNIFESNITRGIGVFEKIVNNSWPAPSATTIRAFPF